MKRLLACLALTLAAIGCAPPSKAPTTPVGLDQAVVGLVEDDVADHAYCTGTWLDQDHFLTCYHCVVENPTKDVYFRQGEHGTFYHGLWTFEDKDHDLAIVYAESQPAHLWASVAPATPKVGDWMFVLGHPVGYWYTLLQGPISAVRGTDSGIHNGLIEDDMDLPGTIIQAQIPIAPGDSGSALVDVNGYIVGVADYGDRRLPGEGFFVGTDSVRDFVTKSLSPKR